MERRMFQGLWMYRNLNFSASSSTVCSCICFSHNLNMIFSEFDQALKSDKSQLQTI
jgi:hypothetical protein